MLKKVRRFLKRYCIKDQYLARKRLKKEEAINIKKEAYKKAPLDKPDDLG